MRLNVQAYAQPRSQDFFPFLYAIISHRVGEMHFQLRG